MVYTGTKNKHWYFDQPLPKIANLLTHQLSIPPGNSGWNRGKWNLNNHVPTWGGGKFSTTRVGWSVIWYKLQVSWNLWAPWRVSASNYHLNSLNKVTFWRMIPPPAPGKLTKNHLKIKESMLGVDDSFGKNDPSVAETQCIPLPGSLEVMIPPNNHVKWHVK